MAGDREELFAQAHRFVGAVEQQPRRVASTHSMRRVRPNAATTAVMRLTFWNQRGGCAKPRSKMKSAATIQQAVASAKSM